MIHLGNTGKQETKVGLEDVCMETYWVGVVWWGEAIKVRGAGMRLCGWFNQSVSDRR